MVNISVRYHAGRVKTRSGLGVKIDLYSINTDHTRCVRLFCVNAPSKPELRRAAQRMRVELHF